MKILAVTTSSPRAGLALLQGSRVTHALEHSRLRGHSEWLHPALIEILEKAKLSPEDITHLAVDQGPGSFTGIRVGFNLVKTLAFTLNLPVFLAPSLEILLYRTPPGTVALTNAFRRMVYCARKLPDETIPAPQALTLGQLSDWLKESPIPKVVGDGPSAIPPLSEMLKDLGLKLPDESNYYPEATTLAFFSQENLNNSQRWTKDWKSILPLYLRASEAEENAKRG